MGNIQKGCYPEESFFRLLFRILILRLIIF